MSQTNKKKVQIKLNPAHKLDGYHARNSTSQRRQALLEAVRRMRSHLEKTKYVPTKKCNSMQANAYRKVAMRLHALRVFDQKRFPELAAIFKQDFQYLMQKHNTVCKRMTK